MTVSTPFLSIIIPVYNAEKYLEHCFASIEKQTFGNYEVILIDDGSKDSSPAICDAYSNRDSRVKCLHVENGGPSRARNIGFKTANGEYIYCIDNDDELISEFFFQKISDFLEKNPVQLLQIGASYCHTDDHNIIQRTMEESGEGTIGQKVRRLVQHRRYETSCWTKFILRSFLLNNELFFNENLLVEDFDWNLRIFQHLENYKILSNTDYLHIYRKGSITSSSSPRKFKSCCDQIATIKTGIDLYLNWKKDEDLQKAILSFCGYQFYITMGHSSVLNTEYQLEIKYKLKELDYILNFSIERKQKFLSIFYRIFGYDVTMIIIKRFFERKHRVMK